MQPEDSQVHHHTRRMQQRLQELIDDLREDVARVDEPQLRAILETSAEVLGGIVKTLRDYEEKSEPAWRGPPSGATPIAGPRKKHGDELSGAASAASTDDALDEP